MEAVAGGASEGAASLPLLQSRIRSDAAAYAGDFAQQWEHFEAELALQREAPGQRAADSFHEELMFIAFTCGRYDGRSAAFFSLLEAALGDPLHPSVRRSLGNALMVLLSQGHIAVDTCLPLFLDLMDAGDKGLRRLVMNNVVRAVSRRRLLVPGSPSRAALREVFLGQLAAVEAGPDRRRRTLKLIIELYRRRAWRDAEQVNQIAALCFSPEAPVALTAAKFMLGTLPMLVDDDDEEDDGADPEAEREKRHTGAKRSRRGLRSRMEREREARERRSARAARRRETAVATSALCVLDSLRDPQSFADRLLRRIRQPKLPFKLRVALTDLASRVVGRFELFVDNLFPLLMRLLDPRRPHVTQMLAAAAQAAHPMWPPAELQAFVRRLMDVFVVDVQTPEVMAVGLNTIREICARAPLALSEPMLADLIDFRKNKLHKAVVAAARSLINLYRDIYPALLARKFRGKSAAIAVAHGAAPAPIYGAHASFVHTATDLMLPGAADAQAEDSDSTAASSGSFSDAQTGDDSDGEEGGRDGFAAGRRGKITVVGEAGGGEVAANGEARIAGNGAKRDTLRADGAGSPADGSRCSSDEDEVGGSQDSCDASSADGSSESSPDDSDSGSGSGDEFDDSESDFDSFEEEADVSSEEGGGGTEAEEPADLTRDEGGVFRRRKRLRLPECAEEVGGKFAVADGGAPPTLPEAPPPPKKLRAALNPLETIFDDAYFRKLRRAKAAAAANEPYTSSDNEGSDSDSEDSDGSEAPLLADTTVVDPESLKPTIRKKGREARLAILHESREGRLSFTQKNKERALASRGSRPQSVQKRNKPLMMVKQKLAIKMKNRNDAKTKISNIRTHIRNMKKHTGGKRKYRRM